MQPPTPYRPGKYPPGPKFAQFGDNLLGESITHAAHTSLVQKRAGMAQFHIGRLQEDGYMPAFQPGSFQTNRDPAEQGVRGFDHFDIAQGDEDWDHGLGERYRTRRDGVDGPLVEDDYTNYNPDLDQKNPFRRGHHTDFPGLPASMETSTGLDKQTHGRQRSEHHGEEDVAAEESAEVGGEGSGRGRLGRAWSAVKTGYRHAAPVGQVGGAVAGAGVVGLGYMGGAMVGLGWGGVKGAASLMGNALSPYPRSVEDYTPAEHAYGGSSSSSSGPAPSTATPEPAAAVPAYLLDAAEREKAARKTPAVYKHLGNFARNSIDRRKLDEQAKQDGTYWSLMDTRTSR